MLPILVVPWEDLSIQAENARDQLVGASRPRPRATLRHRHAPSALSDRALFVGLWRDRLSRWLGAPASVPINGPQFNAEPSVDDYEAVLRALLRRAGRRLWPQTHQALHRLVQTFLSSDACVQALPCDLEVVAWMLQSMYWRGCRHPQALRCKAIHPPTALHRWLSCRRPEPESVGASEDAIANLVREVDRIALRSVDIVRAIGSRQWPGIARIPMLPELLTPPQPRPTARRESIDLKYLYYDFRGG